MKQRRPKRNAATSAPACPVCASKNTTFKYTIERYHFDVQQCNDCRSEFRYPMPKSANAYYDEGYYTGTATFNYQDERREERHHKHVHAARLKSIRRFLRAGGSLFGEKAPREKFLDVGAAFGAFARSAAESFESYGLDVSPFAVTEGNKISETMDNRARLFKGDLCHLPRKSGKIFSPECFSAVTLIEVAEHLQTPRVDFTAAYRLLRPGGVLVIQTANFEGWQAVNAGDAYHYYLPGHLIYYTATGLRRMLRDIGFREFKEFFPVDFSLWAKWRKSWGSVQKLSDLTRFWRMSLYHIKSKFHWRRRPLTSSYVLYARK
jgi:SAM-dependent methyltransferase